MSPEVGDRPQFNGSGYTEPVIFFILRQFLENQFNPSRRFVIAQNKLRGVEFVFLAQQFIGTLILRTRIAHFQSFSVNGFSIIYDGCPQVTFLTEIAVGNHAEVVIGNIFELFRTGNRQRDRFKTRLKVFYHAFGIFCAVTQDKFIGVCAALFNELISADSGRGENLFVTCPVGKRIPDRGAKFMTDTFGKTAVFRKFCNFRMIIFVQFEHKFRRQKSPMSDNAGIGFLGVFADTFTDGEEIFFHHLCRRSEISFDVLIGKFFNIGVDINHQMTGDKVVEQHENLR